MKKTVFSLVTAAVVFASQPQGEYSGTYQAPWIFDVQNKVVYSHGSAEVYLSVKPKLGVDQEVTIRVDSPHPCLQVRLDPHGPWEKKSFTKVRSDREQLFSFHVQKICDYTISAVSVNFEYEYPVEAARGFITSNLSVYSDPQRLASLLEKLPKKEGRDSINVMISSRKFLSAPVKIFPDAEDVKGK